MADNCGSYVSAEDLQAAKQSINHIEHVATSKDVDGNPALVVSDVIRGIEYSNATLDGLFSDIGFKPVDGSFEIGGLLQNRWDTLLYEANGSFYSWMGTLPLAVPSGSSPFDSGGLLIDGWIDHTDITLRTDLAQEDGFGNIGGATYAQIRAYSGLLSRVYCLGRANKLDGGYGFFEVDAADTASADNGGTILVDVSGRRWKRQFVGAVNLRWFEGSFNGVGDDTTAILTAVEYVRDNKGKLNIPAGNYVYSGTSTINVDLGLFSVESEGGAVINCASFTGTNVCRVFSSLTYPSSVYTNPTNTMKGLAFVGGRVDGTVGLLVGMLTTAKAYSGNLHIVDCTFDAFDTNIKMGNTAWRIAFYNVASRYGKTHNYHAPADITESGEDMNFYGCMFADGGEILIEKSNYSMNLHSCSILNTKLHISGTAAFVRMYGGNMENPGAGSFYKYAVLDASHTARLDFIGTTVVCNNAALFIDTPFDVSTRNIIAFNNVKYTSSLNAIETTADNRTLVSGAGEVMSINSSLELNSGGVKFPIHTSMNRLHNSGFELGNTNGWTINNSGQASQTAVASATAKRNGTYGLLVTSIVGQSIFVNQQIQLTVGLQFICSGWVKVATAAASGNAGSITVTFYTQTGTQISSQSSAIPNTVGDFYVNGGFLCGVVPQGTFYATVSLSALNGAVIYFDDILINEL